VISKQKSFPFYLELKHDEDISEIDSIQPERLPPFQWVNPMREVSLAIFSAEGLLLNEHEIEVL
jgi:hypothetical protein